MTDSPNRLYEFGPFRLDPHKRLLWRNGEPISIKPKVFETLLVLVQNRGRVLEKNELMRLLWPDAVVEEGNLNKNISELRRLLGESAREHLYIVTVSSRGYNFVAGVRELAAEGEETIAATRTQITIRREEEPAPPPHSIAVLPFVGLSAEPGNEYFGLGIADALITRLSKLRQMVVRPTSAIARFAATGQDAAAIGRELRVAAVLEGGIRRAGGRIRVSAQLVSAGEGRTLWAAQFDEKFTDIFTVEDQVSTRIASAFAPEMMDEERKLLQQRFTEDIEAYQLFWQGRYHFNQLPLRLEKSIACFQKALGRDPRFAQAHVELAMCHCFRGYFEQAPPRECYLLAQAAVEKALELDEHLAEAHVALGRIKHEYEWDWAGAEKAYLRAIELSPHLAIAHTYYALYLCTMGRAEALTRITRAQELDPVSPLNPTIRGGVLMHQRQYDKAIDVFRSVLETAPAYYPALWNLGMAYEQLGAYNEAIAVFEQARSEANLIHILPHLAHAYAIAGRRAEAEQALAELHAQAERQYVSPFAFVHIYAGLGEVDQAFEWLERAYQARDPKLHYLKVHPRWDSLRADPRFDDLLRRMGLSA
ncbi:MAG: winged helix-turn-helix domain-containing protein [Blastocatellia bacterium]